MAAKEGYLHKSQFTMNVHYVPNPEDYVECHHNGDVSRIMYMPRELWEEMDSPDIITVTIEPGDLLNG